MDVPGVTTVLLVAAVTMGSAQHKKAPKAPPANDACSGPTTQADYTECSEKELKKADAVLAKAYASLLRELDEEHAPILRKAERAWETFRAAECELQSSQFLGGSAQAQLYNDCMAAMAAERVRALQDTRKTLADFISR